MASWQPPLLLHADQRTAAGQPAFKSLFPCRARAGRVAATGAGARRRGRHAAHAGRSAPEIQEKEKGSLEAGKLADFVLFDRDFSRGPVHSIHEANVRMTVAGGRVLYE